jgi:hypothetical protein
MSIKEKDNSLTPPTPFLQATSTLDAVRKIVGTPTPRFLVATKTPTPIPTRASEDSSLVKLVQTIYDEGMEQRDKTRFETLLTVLDEAEKVDEAHTKVWRKYRKATFYALDVFQNSFYFAGEAVRAVFNG